MGKAERCMQKKQRGAEPSSLPVFLPVPFLRHSGSQTLGTGSTTLLSVTTLSLQQLDFLQQEA